MTIPSLGRTEVRTASVSVRFTPAELRIIDMAAAEENLIITGPKTDKPNRSALLQLALAYWLHRPGEDANWRPPNGSIIPDDWDEV